jgi:hypothetical protein
MKLAELKVLLILNEKTPREVAAVPFTRIWCSFEITLCLEQKDLPLDIALCHDSKAVLIKSRREDKSKKFLGDQMQQSSSLRDACVVPLDVMTAGLTAEVEKAKASVLEDRARILNCIVGHSDLMAPPPESHEKYTETNKRLHSLFALAFWRYFLCISELIDRTRREKLWQKMSEAARSDKCRKSLRITLAKCEEAGDEQVAFFLQSLPPNLQELDLDLSNTSISDAIMGRLGTSIPQCMKALTLDLSNCSQITDNGVAELRRNLPESLKQLQVELSSTQVSTEARESLEDLFPSDMQDWLNSLPSIGSRAASDNSIR